MYNEGVGSFVLNADNFAKFSKPAFKILFGCIFAIPFDVHLRIFISWHVGDKVKLWFKMEWEIFTSFYLNLNILIVRPHQNLLFIWLQLWYNFYINEK